MVFISYHSLWLTYGLVYGTLVNLTIVMNPFGVIKTTLRVGMFGPPASEPFGIVGILRNFWLTMMVFPQPPNETFIILTIANLELHAYFKRVVINLQLFRVVHMCKNIISLKSSTSKHVEQLVGNANSCQ